MARLVTVMPTWAPESWVESERRARWTPIAPASPSAAAWSTLLLSTVTKANSAATKTPQAAMSSRAVPRRIHSVSVGSFAVGGAGAATLPAGTLRADFDVDPPGHGAVRRVIDSARTAAGATTARP